PWGRMGFARALIEVMAEKELKQEVKMVVLKIVGEGHTIEHMRVEYEWKPPWCNECRVFGHESVTCLMTSNNVNFIASFIPLITEYLVNISKRARILELKRRYFEDYCSDN
ncbi:hypothetical protein Tco_0070428, partial [Tanacetum coccineum]